MNDYREQVQALVEQLEPLDEREGRDRAEVMSWIASGAPLWRVQKPDVPPQHLVSYFVVVDVERQLLLLVDHIKAGLWLPPGGHVEEGETPRQTVEREIIEELGMTAAFTTVCADTPLFVTRTPTQGQGRHTDVSLWYVVAGDARVTLEYDRREFRGYRWFSFDDLALIRPERLDPEFTRFMRKFELAWSGGKAISL